MLNLCARCERPSADGLTTIVNPYHNGPETIAVCDACLRLGDRIAGPLEIEFDDDEFGPDSATELLDRGPR
jgi:hypothetical protein